MNETVGYLQGNVEHHLDHLAPFCALNGWPLVVTDEGVYELARLYYLELDVKLFDIIQAPFEVTERFDRVVTTLARAAFDDIFSIAEMTLKKRLSTWWLPHGHSDKCGWEALKGEEVILVYGQKMAEKVGGKRVGNFRRAYWERHRKFYEGVLDGMGLPKEFVLYAPTWDAGAFERGIDEVLGLRGEYEVVVKPHPNEVENVQVIQKRLQSECVWLDHFPPVYPLLSRASHFIGDFSSMGYDFLTFNRPLLFYKTIEGSALHKCGEKVVDLQRQMKNPYHPREIIKLVVENIFE